MQFGVNKHELIIQRQQNCTNPWGKNNLWSLKNLPVLICKCTSAHVNVLVALWTCVTTSDFFMYIINELIISIHIKPEWNSSQALHNMGWATQAWCKGVQRWPYGGQGSRDGAVGNWQE